MSVLAGRLAAVVLQLRQVREVDPQLRGDLALSQAPAAAEPLDPLAEGLFGLLVSG